MPIWKPFSRQAKEEASGTSSDDDPENGSTKPPKWSLGVLNDKQTDEVPGSVLLLSKVSKRNEPLGLHHAPARTSSSSLPSPYLPGTVRPRSRTPPKTPTRSDKKKTKDGKIILEPQPEDSVNDPLNWAMWRRNAALMSLGFYCMLGGGMTSVLAAGFNNVAASYHIPVARVALTTGLYMMGLGIGSVIMSPTAILFGKRPVYLATSVLFIVSSVWCALSPDFPSLILARIFLGISVSPVECLPSATIAEIFFLHERAYRLGIYTLLLLGGKNLVPLVSAVIIQALGWRWVFWVVALVVGFSACFLFIFIPETFWDRTPRPKHVTRPRLNSQGSVGTHHLHLPHLPHLFHRPQSRVSGGQGVVETPMSPRAESIRASHQKKKHINAHVAFDEPNNNQNSERQDYASASEDNEKAQIQGEASKESTKTHQLAPVAASDWHHPQNWSVKEDEQDGQPNPTPELHNLNSPYYMEKASEGDYFGFKTSSATVKSTINREPIEETTDANPVTSLETPSTSNPIKKHKTLSPLNTNEEKSPSQSHHPHSPIHTSNFDGLPEHSSSHDKVPYTQFYRTAPAKSFWQSLSIYNGRLNDDNWLKVAIRPFILFAYPAVLWSAMVYALSVGWLIVLSETVAVIYKDKASYNFNSLQTGLVYISPFIGGILGTVVAGKISDYLVRFMARRNDGVYEPEFRLVMALPVAIATTIGLMGFGWSAQERDAWIVPTFFFGVISFGCTLGSTTAITFCVDSYRQYAGEALVTLNFSKNIFHGLVFSLFFTNWLEVDGGKLVFVAAGAIQMACLLFSIPMYIYGKRARMWTVRRNLMERF